MNLTNGKALLTTTPAPKPHFELINVTFVERSSHLSIFDCVSCTSASWTWSWILAATQQVYSPYRGTGDTCRTFLGRARHLSSALHSSFFAMIPWPLEVR